MQNSRQNSCDQLLLVLVRIGVFWPAAKLLMFPKIYCKSVYKVLSRSTEMQHDEHLTKVDNTTQMITEIYFDIQTAARGNTGTKS